MSWTADTVVYTLAGDTFDIVCSALLKLAIVIAYSLFDFETKIFQNANGKKGSCSAKLWCNASTTVVFLVFEAYVATKCLIRLITFGPSQLPLPVANRWFCLCVLYSTAHTGSAC